MSSFAASRQGKIKQVLRTAMIGVQPGDQVMLKGYLRVLLRLEVDLEWVVANGPNVDLFIVNNQFRAADSVIKLLDANSDKPVLYVTRGTAENNGLNDNIIYLPLKKLHRLNYWLFDNVLVLRNNKARHRRIIDESELILDGSDYEDDEEPTLVPTTDKKSSLSPAKDLHNQTQIANDLGELLLDFVKKLRMREDKYYELWVNNDFVGIIHPKRQYIWLSANAANKKYAPDGGWELRDTQRQPSIKNKGEDLVQWLWLQAFYHPDALLPLLSPTVEFHISYWVKPPRDEARRAILRLLTALEFQPITSGQLIEVAEANKEVTHKTLAGLLFSGSLQPSIYELLKADIDSYHTHSTDTHSPSKTSLIGKNNSRSIDDILASREAGETMAPVSSSVDISQVTKSAPDKATPSDVQPASTQQQTSKPKTKKRGFLAKLRDKLGL